MDLQQQSNFGGATLAFLLLFQEREFSIKSSSFVIISKSGETMMTIYDLASFFLWAMQNEK
jgi:hypothetical protein